MPRCYLFKGKDKCDSCHPDCPHMIRTPEKRKEGKMPVIKEIGFYEEPNEVGYVGWIKTADGTYFIDTDGKISKPEM